MLPVWRNCWFRQCSILVSDGISFCTHVAVDCSTRSDTDAKLQHCKADLALFDPPWLPAHKKQVMRSKDPPGPGARLAGFIKPPEAIHGFFRENLFPPVAEPEQFQVKHVIARNCLERTVPVSRSHFRGGTTLLRIPPAL